EHHRRRHPVRGFRPVQRLQRQPRSPRRLVHHRPGQRLRRPLRLRHRRHCLPPRRHQRRGHRRRRRRWRDLPPVGHLARVPQGSRHRLPRLVRQR
ncbi:hypothetical protein BN1708_019512, partial [Verticillium longisporum]